MSHKNEAEETLGQVHIWASEEADLDKVVDLLYMQANIACAQVEATLALVDAQEAANELKRVEVLVMLAQGGHGGRMGFESQASRELNDGRYSDIRLSPRIARVLGIDVAE